MANKKRSAKKIVFDKCDDLWKWIMHQKGYCEVCGPPEEVPYVEFGKTVKGLDAHHIITRGNLNLRWDLRCGVLLCKSHHKFGRYSAHGHLPWFAEWLKKNRAEDYEYLKDPEHTKTHTWHLYDYEDIYNRLRNEVI